ncbi:hypothetical protein EG68_08126 [Paragonimus skrjabini miyazakii]|uniref:Uncharacterized protein n=1 Tax=Paragonimus skrjabini miyazakii TaxID=59628 RepID=A0A8S9YK55_9TREM|nr:hypothetical protein EG68_08126 [Paragonimus skrjabini miyazakii]
MEMLAICKGLHYNLWMQDKLLLKEEVVRRTCEILPLIPNSTVRFYYINGIFETLAREWDRLDNWRVDKFMLLTRDFFTQGLHSFAPVNPQLWDSFLEAVFEKVLNEDVQHAIGLKLHMCNIIGEELSKKKVKTFCIVSALKCLVSRLVGLPRHHSYAHALLRLIHVLLSTLRRRSKVCKYFLEHSIFKPSIDDLINTVSSLEKSGTTHKKSLRKIEAILVSIRTKKAKNIPSVQQKHPIAEDEHVPPGHCADPEFPEMSVVPPVAETMVTSPVHSDAPPSSSPPVSSPSPSSGEGNDHGNVELHSSSLSSSVQTEPTNLLVASPNEKLETPLSRRVSFGKVFRKKFKSSQRLSMTPTVRTTPKKGILRAQVQNNVKPRISL